MPGGGGGSGPLISGGPGDGPFPRPNPSAMSMRVMMSDGPSCRPDALDAAAMSGGNGSAESMRLRTLVGSELPLGLTSFPKRSTRNRFVGGPDSLCARGGKFMFPGSGLTIVSVHTPRNQFNDSHFPRSVSVF